MALVDSLIDLIRTGSLNAAFNHIPELLNKLKDKDTRNSLVYLSSRHHGLKKQINSGPISSADAICRTVLPLPIIIPSIMSNRYNVNHIVL